jgi:hypothetical protein
MLQIQPINHFEMFRVKVLGKNSNGSKISTQKFNYVQYEKLWIYYSVQNRLTSRPLPKNLKFKVQL